MADTDAKLMNQLTTRFDAVIDRLPCDSISTVSVAPEQIADTLKFLKYTATPRYEMLFDLSAIDDTERNSKLTVFYQLLSLSGNTDLRIKVHVPSNAPVLPSICSVWQCANWYERELYDMFGIYISDHPNLQRILMPEYWEGHPLRKEHPSRATEMAPYSLPEERYRTIMESYRAEDYHEPGSAENEITLNIGPTHPGTHGLLRLVVRLEGETIRSVRPEIGFHHRGAEKMAERQTYHSYIPYTDRIDYLSGVQNELPYVLAVEQLAGIEVPERAQVMRVMLCELFRISSHLVWLASYSHDLGALAPPFYTFRDREYLFDVMEMITGGRMHPAFFRIGGVALDLPEGWNPALRAFLKRMPDAVDEYQALLTGNTIMRRRSRGIGIMSAQNAIDWGISGPNLRASGVDWDLRKRRPYSGYEHYDFDVPTATEGDSLARAELRLEEIRQSLRIVEQAMANMPEGPVLSDQARYAFARKAATLQDIETLIHHFITVGHGMTFPAGESLFITEAPKGMNGYYVVSNGTEHPHRLRIRTPSFPHMQALALLATGHFLADLFAILGSIDYILADIDR
ncbi:NADH-quinone oxidoreductase subunit C/D/NADH-quinone oxidoreductase subunit B/C/D [Nitrosomonas marina]|uniref:Multifunctional fusion protein n=1 Tax=Nitrosomonas marina TaxID=917 RepID=A0A1H9ZXG0_9PROT|nr:NADH dehydrogenase (quinone) subunit D [Nitrosomonas marina]SES86463.1 NADH-quinone oxidoreductase subunit C/D/NADH-quinone oxidoreductase subunit B/C/D [Nitrosomonas marina]